MGWSSGTGIFDDIFPLIRDLELSEETRVKLVTKIIKTFEYSDWDGQDESQYAEDPIFRAALRRLHPDWDTYDR